jgi:hypothetical protein
MWTERTTNNWKYLFSKYFKSIKYIIAWGNLYNSLKGSTSTLFNLNTTDFGLDVEQYNQARPHREPNPSLAHRPGKQNCDALEKL